MIKPHLCSAEEHPAKWLIVADLVEMTDEHTVIFLNLLVSCLLWLVELHVPMVDQGRFPN